MFHRLKCSRSSAPWCAALGESRLQGGKSDPWSEDTSTIGSRSASSAEPQLECLSGDAACSRNLRDGFPEGLRRELCCTAAFRLMAWRSPPCAWSPLLREWFVLLSCLVVDDSPVPAGWVGGYVYFAIGLKALRGVP